jgi:hypothetical protein
MFVTSCTLSKITHGKQYSLRVGHNSVGKQYAKLNCTIIPMFSKSFNKTELKSEKKISFTFLRYYVLKVFYRS